MQLVDAWLHLGRCRAVGRSFIHCLKLSCFIEAIAQAIGRYQMTASVTDKPWHGALHSAAINLVRLMIGMEPYGAPALSRLRN
jgi:hypothetical protein